MNPARDLEYPFVFDVPDEPIEPDCDEDSDCEIPAEHALDKDDEPGDHEREEDPDSEDTPSEDTDERPTRSNSKTRQIGWVQGTGGVSA